MEFSILKSALKPIFNPDWILHYGGWFLAGKSGAQTTRVDKFNIASLAVTNSFAALTRAKGYLAIGISKKSGGRGFATGGIAGGVSPFVYYDEHESHQISSGGTLTPHSGMGVAKAYHAGACSDTYFYVIGGATTGPVNNDTIYRQKVTATSPPTILSSVITLAVRNLEANTTESYAFIVGGIISGTIGVDFTNIMLLESGSGNRVHWTLGDELFGRATSGNESRTFIAGGANGSEDSYSITASIKEWSNNAKSLSATFGSMAVAKYRFSGASSQHRTILTNGQDSAGTAFAQGREYFNHQSKSNAVNFSTSSELMGGIMSDSGSH